MTGSFRKKNAQTDCLEHGLHGLNETIARQ